MKKLFFISTFIFLIMQMNCIKKDFTPTVANVNDEQYMKQVNTTIAELRSWIPDDGSIYKIPDNANWVIQGVIISSDVNGNFYKSIHIQDSTAGIQLLIDGSGLYASYPMGMRVFIKLAGLGLTSYNNQIELGMFDNTTQKIINIPLKLADNYIVKGSLKNGVDTLKISDITSLSSIYQSRLVKLSNVMIDIAEAGIQTMGDVVSQSNSYSLSIQDKRKNAVALVTSPFANFANQIAPKGAGYIVAVATQYRDAIQLVVNGMEEIHFNPNDTVVLEANIPENWEVKPISEVRKYIGNASRIPLLEDTAIRGIVVSDNSFKNMQDTQIFVQQPDDNNKALLVLLPKTMKNNLNFGDEVVINIKGAVLVRNSAGLAVSFSTADGASGKLPQIVLVSKNNTITPIEITLDDIKNNFDQYESQLVKLNAIYCVSENDRGKPFKPLFSKNYSFMQKGSTANIEFRVLSSYTGAHNIPNGLANITAILASFNKSPQMIMRMPADVVDLGAPAPERAFFENFEAGSKNSYDKAPNEATCTMGDWYMKNIMTATTNNDLKNDKQSIRFQTGTIDTLTMQFDKRKGVGRITLYHGLFVSDANKKGSFVLEVSNDGGNIWGYKSNVVNVTATFTQTTFDVNMDGNIRIRITTPSNTGRINIDDIAISDYAPTVAMPTFTPVAGTYESPQNITITTTTPSADIYYTTNGNIPTITSTKYTAPFALTATTSSQTIMLKAIAVASGMVNSAVASAEYTITPPGVVADPVFSPAAGTYNSTQNVTITCATTGAEIYYTTDGSTPTSSSTQYTGAIAVDKNTTIKAIAVKGANSSNVATTDYKIKLPMPTFFPPAGTYTNVQSVTITSATVGADIYYTTDGSTPTTSSQMYSSAINVASTTTIKAIAVKAGMESSEMAEAKYTIGGVTPSIPNVVISGVYGGGGNSGATYKNDYIELYNTTNAEIDLTGYTLYYASSTGTSATASNTYTFPAGSKIGSKKFVLIKCAAGTTILTDWNISFDFDASGNKGSNMGMSATAGKILLLNKFVDLTANNSIPTTLVDIQAMGGYIDYMPFGNTSTPIFGSATKNLSATTVAKRKYITTIQYTFDVGADFEIVTADATAPRNSSTNP